MTGEKIGSPESRDRPRAAVVAYTEYPWDPRVRNEAETLLQEGYVVHVIAVRPKSGPSPPHQNGVHLWEVPLVTRRGRKARYLYQYAMFFLLSTVLLLKFHVRRRFDFVHVHSLPDFQVFSTIPLKVWRVPVLLDLHEAMPEILAARFNLESRSLMFRVAALLERLSCRYANHVIAANDGIRAAVVARGTPPSHVTTVYNAGEIPGTLPSPAGLRNQLGVPTGHLIVHAGGINPERDLETLLGAISQLSATLEVHLVIAGDGERAYVDSIRKLASDFGLANRVHFVGKVPREQALALMSLSDVGVVTLESNPLTELAWPTRIVEFANLGKPLVVPNLRFLREALQGTAKYYIPGNPIDLSRVLGAVLSNPEALVSSVAKDREFANRFKWSKMKKTFLAVCEGIG